MHIGLVLLCLPEICLVVTRKERSCKGNVPSPSVFKSTPLRPLTSTVYDYIAQFFWLDKAGLSSLWLPHCGHCGSEPGASTIGIHFGSLAARHQAGLNTVDCGTRQTSDFSSLLSALTDRNLCLHIMSRKLLCLDYHSRMLTFLQDTLLP